MPTQQKQWLKQHVNDYYVKQAKIDGYPSRAAYKLLELQTKDRLIQKGMCIIDLGAAPGGWSMVARQLVGAQGRIIGVDRLAMQPIDGVEFIQGDFTEQAILDHLQQRIGAQPVDLIISDMAPNLTGHKSVDLPKTLYLAELALDLAQRVLKPEGTLLLKVFQGIGIEQFAADLKRCFKQIKWRKPQASRSQSRELYLLATGFLGYNVYIKD